MQRIMYAIHKPDGIVVSRLGSDVAVPVLQYKDCNPKNGFRMRYKLERFNVHDACRDWLSYKWTTKIPRALKNRHRRFWGMKPIAA